MIRYRFHADEISSLQMRGNLLHVIYDLDSCQLFSIVNDRSIYIVFSLCQKNFNNQPRGQVRSHNSLARIKDINCVPPLVHISASLTRIGTFNPTYHLLNLMIFNNCTCMFTSANYQLIRSNSTDSNVHGNEKSVPSTRGEVNVIKIQKQ